MHPQIQINLPAVAAAVGANFVFGFLWFGPLFGKAWAKAMNFPPDFKPGPGVMVRGMIFMIVGNFLTAYVLAHSVAVWRPSVWNAGADEPAWKYGFFAGLFTWVGFYIPLLLGAVAWENKSWKLFGINAAYHFLALQIVGAILTFWR